MWRISAELIAALDTKLGDPLDAYVNGSQTWLEENGPNGITVEWRLHPRANYQRPQGIDTYGVFRAAADGDIEPATLWDGLEAFPAYENDNSNNADVGNRTTTVADLRAAATAALGVEPTAWGMVDHAPIGDEWERTAGGISIVDRLLDQLARHDGDVGHAGGDTE